MTKRNDINMQIKTYIAEALQDVIEQNKMQES